MLRNRKAQEGDELSSGLIAVATVLLIGASLFLYLSITKGKVDARNSSALVDRDVEIQTTNYLNMILNAREEYGNSYAKDIKLALSTPNLKHPNGLTYEQFLQGTLKDKVCSILSDSLAENTYQLLVKKGGNTVFECGVVPNSQESVASVVQFLPTNAGENIEVVLERWIL